MDVFRRQTVLDVIDNNLRSLNTKSFVIRTIIAGKHNFSTSESFSNIFSANIQKINVAYCDVPVYGILLLYKEHFFIVSEGSEYTVMRQINLLLKNDDLNRNVNHLKVLAVYHNIKNIIFNSWKMMSIEPPSLISAFEGELTEFKVTEILQTCIEKIQYLCDNWKNSQADIDFKIRALPEIIMTDVLLASSFIMDLQTYSNMYLKLGEYSYSFENCWPAPFDFTPCLEIEETSKNTFVELFSSIDDFNMTDDSTIRII